MKSRVPVSHRRRCEIVGSRVRSSEFGHMSQTSTTQCMHAPQSNANFVAIVRPPLSQIATGAFEFFYRNSFREGGIAPSTSRRSQKKIAVLRAAFLYLPEPLSIFALSCKSFPEYRTAPARMIPISLFLWEKF